MNEGREPGAEGQAPEIGTDGQPEVPQDEVPPEGGEAPAVASETDGTHNTLPIEIALLSEIAICCSSCGLLASTRMTSALITRIQPLLLAFRFSVAFYTKSFLCSCYTM